MTIVKAVFGGFRASNAARHFGTLRGAPSLTFRGIENLFLVLWLCIGLLAAVVSPAGFGKDEATHVARASQIAQGVFLPQEVSVGEIDKSFLSVSEEYSQDKIFGGSEDKSMFDLLRVGSRIIREGTEDVSAIQLSSPYWADDAFADIGLLGEEDVVWAFPNTSVNSPLCYIPYSVAYFLATLLSRSPIFALILMRLLGVLAYGLLVRFAIKNAPFGKNAMALLALLPNCVVVCSTVSADMMTIAVSFVFFSYLLRALFYYRELKCRDFVLFGSSLCLLALLKMPYIIFGLALILVFVVNRLWTDRRETAKLALMGGLALGFFLAWQCVIRGINTYAIWGISGVDSHAQLAYVCKNLLPTAGSILGNIFNSDLGLLGLNDYCAKGFPSWFVLVAAVCVVSVDVRDLPRCQSKRFVAVCLLLLAGFVIVVINLALYLTFTPVGDSQVCGMQSRYYVPALIPLFIALILLCSKNGTDGRASECVADSAEDVLANTGIVTAPMAVLFVLMFAFALRMFSIWLPL